LSKRRVVVTGLGIVSPVGNDVASAWARSRRPQRHRPVTRFDTSNFPDALRRRDPQPRSRALHQRQGSAPHGRLHAIRRRRRHAGHARFRVRGHRGQFRSRRRADGLRHGRARVDRGGLRRYLETHSPKKVSPFFIPGSIINLVSGHLSIAFKMTGPNLAVATACTTSTHAIGLAMRLIQYGDADAMLAGGSEMATCARPA
jgi:3-oxoacyl-[acyl-carrier-protein] synthase II